MAEHQALPALPIAPGALGPGLPGHSCRSEGTGGPTSAVDNLQQIVAISQEIRTVRQVASRINTMALNALFLAKRAGNLALGFGVLSSELRVFSDDLHRQMDRLSSMIYAAVSDISSMLLEERRTRILALLSGDLVRQQLQQVTVRRQRQQQASRQQLRRSRRQLHETVNETVSLVELGSVMAKSAKIEAAYGASFSPALSQVSNEFDTVVDEIRNALQRISKSGFLRDHPP